MPLSANTIANYFTNRIRESGRPVTRRTLTNLVFYSHSWFLGLSSEPLVNETFISTKLGPMIDKVEPALQEISQEHILIFLDNFWSAFSSMSDEELNKKISEEPLFRDKKTLTILSVDDIRDYFQKKEELISKKGSIPVAKKKKPRKTTIKIKE